MTGRLAIVLILAILLVGCGDTSLEQLPADAPLIDRAYAAVEDTVIGDVYGVIIDGPNRVVETKFAIGSYDLAMTDLKMLQIICALKKLAEFDGYSFDITGRMQVMDTLGNPFTVDGLHAIIGPDNIAALNCQMIGSLRLQPIADVYQKHRLLD